MSSNDNKDVNQGEPKSPGWKSGFKPFSDIISWFKEIGGRFKFVIIALVVLVMLVLYVSLLNGINELLQGKPLLVQYFTWTLLGLGSFTVIGFVIYYKGRRDGRVLSKELQIRLSEHQDLNKRMHQAVENYERELDKRNEQIVSLEKKIVKKDNTFHDLKKEIDGIKLDEVRDSLLKKWNDLGEIAEVAKERIQETPNKMVQTIKHVPGELKDRSKRVFSKTQELLKIAETEGEKGFTRFKKIFRKGKSKGKRTNKF